MIALVPSLAAWLTRFAKRAPDQTTKAFLNRIDSWVVSGRAVGCVVLVRRKGHTLVQVAAGSRDRELPDRMRPDSIFRLTSLSKPFVCAAALALVDRHKLSLSDTVETYIPSFRDQRLWDGTKPSRPILIRDLMIHSSGLLDSVPESFLATDYSLAEMVELAAHEPLAFSPGDKWAYANMGMEVLGRIIEVVSGMPFEDFTTRRILQPLAMHSSCYVLPRAWEERLAIAYSGVSGEAVRQDPGPARLKSRYISPSNGLHSTAPDLARFFEMLLNGGSLRGRRVLSKDSVALMTASQTGDWDSGFIPGFGYGLGLGVVKTPTGIFRDYAPGTFGHGGRYQLHAWADPVQKLVSIVLCQQLCPQALVSEEVGDLLSRSATLNASSHKSDN